MAIEEVRLGQPSSAIMGGEEGLVIPTGPESARGVVQENGQVRGNDDTAQLEIFLNGQWRVYDPAKKLRSPVTFTTTVATNEIVPANTTPRAFTVRLPLNAVIGDTVTIFDAEGTFDVNNLTVDPQTELIDGNSGSVVIRKRGAYKSYLFTGSGRGWLDTGAKEAIRSQVLSNTGYPVNLESGVTYFASLATTDDIEITLPPSPQAGDEIEFHGLEKNLNFLGKSVLIIRNATGEWLDGFEANARVDTVTNSFRLIYSGQANPGWFVKDDVADSVKLFPFTTNSGNFNGFNTPGRHPINGSTNGFTNTPSVPTSRLTGILDIAIVGTSILQELTAYDDGVDGSRAVKYIRFGDWDGTTASNWSYWNMTLMGITGNYVSLSGQSRIDGKTEGSVFYYSPVAGTPDHEGGDDYLVETRNNRSADPHTPDGPVEKIVYATNWRTKQLWVGAADAAGNDQVTQWRKEGPLLFKYPSTGTYDVAPAAPSTTILLQSTGDQQVNLNLPNSVGAKRGQRDGDLITVRNANEDIGITNIISDIDVIDINGVSIGTGPHIMEGQGHITFALSRKNDDTYELRISDDSREPVRGITAVTLVNSSYPFTAELNTRYFTSLAGAAALIFTLPPEPEPGDVIEFLGQEDDLKFTNKPVTLIRGTTGERINGGTSNFVINDAANSFKLYYSGQANPGWLVRDVTPDSVNLHPNLLTAGNFNTFTAPGRHSVKGTVANLASGPYVPFTGYAGTLDVSIAGDSILQELTIDNSAVDSSRVVKFVRSGGWNGTTAHTWGEWNLLLTGVPGDNGTFTGAARIDGLGGGFAYFINPTVGTPDHKAGDDYLVETITNKTADHFVINSSAEKIVRAINYRTKQEWVGIALINGSVASWRKLGVGHADPTNATTDVPISAPKTVITCTTSGNRRINLKLPTAIGGIGAAREGDIVTIRNLNSAVGVTTIYSDVSLINTDGTNIGAGPHTMTGEGHVELLLRSNGSSNFEFKVLTGVKA